MTKSNRPKLPKIDPEQSMRNSAAIRGIPFEQYKAQVEAFNKTQKDSH